MAAVRDSSSSIGAWGEEFVVADQYLEGFEGLALCRSISDTTPNLSLLYKMIDLHLISLDQLHNVDKQTGTRNQFPLSTGGSWKPQEILWDQCGLGDGLPTCQQGIPLKWHGDLQNGNGDLQNGVESCQMVSVNSADSYKMAS